MRIAITMRIVDTEGYDEPRDALAQDWAGFMSHVFPDANWMPFPNVGVDAVAMAEAWNIDGVILSGGNDLEERPLRDTTEKALLTWAVSTGKPIFGVCRGLQLIQDYFGGSLVQCEGHVASRHQVRIPTTNMLGQAGTVLDVTSFHNWTIATPAPGLSSMAIDAHGEVEAMIHQKHRVGGVMWHPEREVNYAESDIKLMHRFFYGEQ